MGFVAGVLIGEGSAQRTHQQDLQQFLQMVIDSDPDDSQLGAEFGFGTQVFLIGALPEEAARQQLQFELQRRFGEDRGEDFLNQGEVAGHSAAGL